MFSGIVQHVGAVAAVQPHEAGRVLLIDPRGWTHRPASGDSIAVSGCCLTATSDPGSPSLRFDVIRQTLEVTTLGELRPDDRVNLEPALSVGGALDGHIVQGHVDGVGIVLRADFGERESRLRIEPPAALLSSIVERGSIAVAGVSLTVAALGDTWFEVALVPTTLERTTLGALSAGSRVNIETDYLVKAVARWLEFNGTAATPRAIPKASSAAPARSRPRGGRSG